MGFYAHKLEHYAKVSNDEDELHELLETGKIIQSVFDKFEQIAVKKI